MDYLTSTRDFFDAKWDWCMSQFGRDEKLIFVGGSSLVLFISFWGTCSFFLFLDYFGHPASLHKYKIQKDKNIPVNRERFWKCFKVAFTNECISYLMIYLMYPYMGQMGMSFQSPLPPVWRVLLEFYVFAYAAEFIFYYSHRGFHHPSVYKYIHKQHHEWIAPISMAASYAHPLEHIISNAIPVILPPILLGSHMLTTWYWFALAQFSTVLNHSDYHLPGLNSPQFHDYHHLKFTECFGTNGLLDAWHGTDTNFKKSVQFKRHKKFYSFTPISEQFPSAKEKEN